MSTTRQSLSYNDTRGWRGFVAGFADPDDCEFEIILNSEYEIVYITKSVPEAWRIDADRFGARIIAKSQDGYYDVITGAGLVIQLYPTSIWFDDETDLKSIVDAYNMFDALIAEETSSSHNPDRRIRLRATPAATGVALLKLTFPDGEECAPLSQDMRQIITCTQRTTPQSRTETYKKRGKIPGLFLYDVRRNYQHRMRVAWIPVGEPRLQVNNVEYIPYEPAWYLATVKVPEDWGHIGLISYNGNWPSAQGETFTTWISEPEMRLLMMPERRCPSRDESLPSIEQHWEVKLRERLWFRPIGNLEAGNSLMREFIIRMDAIEDAAINRGNNLVPRACRHIRYDTLGRLFPSGTIRETIPAEDYDEENYSDTADVQVSSDGKNVIVKDRKITKGTEAPQLTAQIWASSRARITKFALELPIETLVGINADAILTTEPHDFYRYRNRRGEGNLRLQGSEIGPLTPPTSVEKMRALIRKVKSDVE